MEDLDKSVLSEEELDGVSGGTRGGGGKAKWMYKFEYQKTPGQFVSIVSKEKYGSRLKAEDAGNADRRKYLSKNPSPLVVFEERGHGPFRKK